MIFDVLPIVYGGHAAGFANANGMSLQETQANLPLPESDYSEIVWS
jgi:hypothetical protein